MIQDGSIGLAVKFGVAQATSISVREKPEIHVVIRHENIAG